MWHSLHNCCKGCGTTSHRYVGRGFCSVCYPKETEGRQHNGGWSRSHDRCVSCGRSDKPHVGRGLCATCYQRAWAKSNPDIVLKAKAAFYARNRSELIRQANVDKNGEAGVRMRSSGVCSVCGSQDKLQVHHKDHKGHNVPKHERNQDPENIEILCRSCHGRLHVKEGHRAMMAARKAKVQSKPEAKAPDVIC